MDSVVSQWLCAALVVAEQTFLKGGVSELRTHKPGSLSTWDLKVRFEVVNPNRYSYK